MTKEQFEEIIRQEANRVFEGRGVEAVNDGFEVDGVDIGGVDASEPFLAIWSEGDARKFANDYFSARLPMLA